MTKLHPLWTSLRRTTPEPVSYFVRDVKDMLPNDNERFDAESGALIAVVVCVLFAGMALASMVLAMLSLH